MLTIYSNLKKVNMTRALALGLTLFWAQNLLALPIDWHGHFGASSTHYNAFRKIDTKKYDGHQSGSQEVPLASGNEANASFQSYLLRLNPTLIINDSATFFGEISTGYGRGGFLGESSKTSQSDSTPHSLYYYNTTDTSQKLHLNRFYVELYSDLATFVIGRHNYHWGLGAIVHGGEDKWDRHQFIRDGMTIKIQIGNFHLHPYISKMGVSSSLTTATKTTEHGIGLLYDNHERDLSFGVLYAKKENGPFNKTLKSDISDNNTSDAKNLGKSDITITDIYLKKAFGDFEFAVEAPFISGDLGYLYSYLYTDTTGTKGKSTIKARGVIIEASYNLGDNWKFSAMAGHASGDSGVEGKFGALFLNPNYQVANIMFRYNRYAMADTANYHLYDSYITNTKYAKLYAQYKTDQWLWYGAFIYAKANEVAKAGTDSYNHTTNKRFAATYSQKDDLGMEVDLGITYLWNKEINVGVDLGYHFVGNYYTYTNTATDPKAKNTFLINIKSSFSF